MLLSMLAGSPQVLLSASTTCSTERSEVQNTLEQPAWPYDREQAMRSVVKVSWGLCMVGITSTQLQGHPGHGYTLTGHTRARLSQ